MQINIYTAIGMLFIHWIADFVLQTHKQAIGKSTNNNDLFGHTFTYSLLWFVASFIYAICNHYGLLYSLLLASAFAIITFISHTVQDYFTSRLNSRLWKKNKVHDFFVAIGFDQLLHYIQLFFTYEFVFYFLAKLL